MTTHLQALSAMRARINTLARPLRDPECLREELEELLDILISAASAASAGDGDRDARVSHGGKDED